MISPRALPAASPSPEPPSAAWPSYALSARVAEALGVALGALDRLAATGPAVAHGPPPLTALRETALLVRAVLALDSSVHAALVAQAREVATALATVARAPVMVERLVWHPADARDIAFAHLVLTASGRPDGHFHTRLSRALAAPTSNSGERLPHQRLRHAWLALLDDTTVDALDVMADHTALASPIDLCDALPIDLHAVADALRWVTDVGRRAPRLARAVPTVLDEVEGALAIAIDAELVQLTAGLLLAWPMLHVPWPPTASFAFAWVVSREQERHASLETACAVGMLAAVSLAGPWRPAGDWPPDPSRGPLWHMLRGRLDLSHSPSWVPLLDSIPWDRQRGLTTLLLDVALRRALATHDLTAVRELLVSVEANGGRGTALCQQAASLLGRLDREPPQRP
jgi:hypothetical protein